MEEDLYDTSKLIETYNKGGATHGYTTILNLVRLQFSSKDIYRIIKKR